MARRQAVIRSLRARIDAVDARIVVALAERAVLVRRVHAEKVTSGTVVRDLSREAAIVEGYAALGIAEVSPGASRLAAASVLGATRHNRRMVTLIGQAPSRSAGSRRAFDGRSGRRLALFLGVDPSMLPRLARLRNLLPAWPGPASGAKGDAFPSAAARSAAGSMRLRGTVLLAGRGVARAIGVRAPFFEWVELRGCRAAVIPHPSGVSRWWNDPRNAARARRFLRRAIIGA
jgi:chorismate mutase